MNQNYTYFCHPGKNIHLLVFHRTLIVCLYVPWDEKGWKIAVLESHRSVSFSFVLDSLQDRMVTTKNREVLINGGNPYLKPTKSLAIIVFIISHLNYSYILFWNYSGLLFDFVNDTFSLKKKIHRKL